MTNDCDPQRDATVVGLFEQQVRDNPDRLAVGFEETELTYGQLDALAGQFAAALQASGVAFGDHVGLCIDRSPEAIAAMLGALKLGAVFVPIDPEYPLDRVEFMLRDTKIRTLITKQRSENPVARLLSQSSIAPELTWVDCACIEFANTPAIYQARCVESEDLAYVMYTSGSTGNPKGVQIEHGALTTYCLADIEVYRLQANDRTLQFSTLCFDIAIEEIFPPLLIGSAVVVRPSLRATAANELSQIVDQYGITAVHLATAYWHEWVDLMAASGANAPESLRLVIATGEKVSVEHYRRWLKLCQHDVYWCNAYGPTEATVTATVFVPPTDFDEEQMPIGKPLPGYDAWILDEAHAPVSDRETGHLYISGPALARGYQNRDDLTDAVFLDVDLPNVGRLRLYKTGDLARWLPSGDIEFAGRVDHQIKLGSYRIEPGEIEAVLNTHPDVLDSLVLYEQVGSQKYLVAYAAVKQTDLSVDGLAQHLASQLPVYMVPARYILLERFPKTINGKVDRRALPAAETARVAARTSYVPPATEMQRKLAAIWQDVLQIPQVGQNDDFFALGGSSLLVTRVVTELTTEYEIDLPVRDFFANPTLAELSSHLGLLLGEDQTTDGDHQAIVDARRRKLPHVHPEFFNSGGRQLFGVRYEPRADGDVQPKEHAILICNPLGHEYTRAYRNLQQLAVQLCQAGYSVLRFDYFATGNSAGCDTEVRAETMRSDVRAAAEYLREKSQPGKLSILGLRLGATVAATAQVEDLEHLILWDPVVSGRNFALQLDHLHQRALHSQTRYAHRVNASDPDQAYGHAMDPEKEASLAGLLLPSAEECKQLARQSVLIHSQAYAEDEPGVDSYLDTLANTKTSDEIYWQSAEFTESAFASPDGFQSVQEILSGEAINNA